MYHPTSFAITGPQLHRLFKGHQIQLSKEALQKPNSNVHVHPLMAKKIHAAKMKGTGVRLSMSPHEITHMGGRGWFSDAWSYLSRKAPEVYHWIKDTAVPAVIDAAKWTKDNIIDSDLYQNTIRPKIREKLEDFAESKPYSGYTIPTIEYLGDKTGAFGLKGKKHAKPRAKRITGASFKV